MKQRLDRLLVEQKLAPSREKAQALVMAGKVRVYGQPAGKSGHVIDVDSHLEVLGDDQPFVSRGGVKLQAALKYFKINPSGLVALDIGSSTGGFSHCLILGGAEKVLRLMSAMASLPGSCSRIRVLCPWNVQIFVISNLNVLVKL